MSKKKSNVEIAKKLENIKIFEFQYLHEKSKIRWRNKKEQIVAYADCKAIMSFASTNNSYRWGLRPDAENISKPDWIESYKDDVTESETRELAERASDEAGADFMFAGNWLSLTIYLACFNIVFEDDTIVDTSVPWHSVADQMSKYAPFIQNVIDYI